MPLSADSASVEIRHLRGYAGGLARGPRLACVQSAVEAHGHGVHALAATLVLGSSLFVPGNSLSLLPYPSASG